MALVSPARSGVASTLVQDISQQVTCSICLEHFKVPKTLPCLHNFCSECLQETIQSSAHPKLPDPTNYQANNNVVFSFPCPACRAEVDFPVASLQPWDMREVANRAVTSAFKTNFHIESQIDMLEKKMKQGCLEHQGETLLFFCKTCDKAICQLCLALEHTPPEHDITSVHKVAKEKRDELRSKKDSVVKKKTELEQALKGCQHKLKDMQKVKSQCKKASQELDNLNVVIAEVKKVMSKTEHNLTTRVSRMINDNQMILNRIEQCQKKNDQLDTILARTDQELLQQQSLEDEGSIQESLPQILQVSATSMSSCPQIEKGLQHICKSILYIKSQLRRFCVQHSQSSSTTASTHSKQPPRQPPPGFVASQPPGLVVSQSPGLVVSHPPQFTVSQSQPLSIPPFQSHIRFPQPFPSTCSSSSFPRPLVATNVPNMWLSPWAIPQRIRGTFCSPPPPPPGLHQQHTCFKNSQQQNVGMPDFQQGPAMSPLGTTHPERLSTNQVGKLQVMVVEKSVLFPTVSTAVVDDYDDEEDDDEADYVGCPDSYRDVWSGEDSDY